MSIEVNFVSNYSADDMGGGWNGTNGNTWKGLSSQFAAQYVGPINPPTPLVAKLFSKIVRSAGRPGTMPVFGRARLTNIANLYRLRRSSQAKLDHFHGATPWVLCDPPCAYSAYIDATFPQYMEVFANKNEFRSVDRARIENDEAMFLRGADLVFFGSDWARQNAIERYALEKRKTRIVYTGGKVPIPEQDQYAGSATFLFVSLNFEKKGGDIAVRAIENIRGDILPNAELVILGEKPPIEILSKPGIRYGGLLKKNDPSQLKTLTNYFATARGLIHPTSQDTMGSVLIEAAYYGCPAVTTKDFGVPEFVLDRRTGYLVDSPANVDDVTNAVARLCEESESYYDMRANALNHSHSNLTFEVMVRRMAEGIRELVE